MAGTLLILTLAAACCRSGFAHFSLEELSAYHELDGSAPSGAALGAVVDGQLVLGSGAGRRALLQEGDPLANTCAVAKGTWCGPYYKQALEKRVPIKRGSKPCPNDCSGVGVCHHDFGICYCPAGFGSDDCSLPRKRPCWRMGADKRDEGWHKHEDWSHSRCAGVCDDDLAMCYCPPETRFGHILAEADAPLGAPPLQRGRPMYWCQPSSDKDGNPVKWGAVTYDNLLGPDGWCNADIPNFFCPCRLDGMLGSMCNIAVEHFCPNQCSGHGDCYLGFCKCHEGWYGSDCAKLKAGLTYTPPEWEPPANNRAAPKPWLYQSARFPVAAEDPPRLSHRRRPYVYVYDMKPEVSTDVLQYRIERHHCTYRLFEHGNQSSWVGYNAYATESVLHELFLTSEHRTMDPDEADYFYVPLPFACLFDVYGWNPIPRWPADIHGPRPYGAANMQREAQKWIQATFPYFDRRGGRDHIWFTPHDEGACYVWKEVWPGIVLTHWGRTDFPHTPNTQYHADNYGTSIFHKETEGEWLDHTSKAHPCFDPKKDLVIPAFKRPTHYSRSPYLGDEARDRSVFLFFRGDLRIAPGQDPDCKYSRCIRQTLFNLSRAGNWREKYNVLLGEQQHVQGDYSALLSKSLFCLVPPGDGWSPRLEDAVLHGCIPVIIMDDVQVVFESILDVPSFSIRIAQKDMHNIIDTLKAVPQDKIEAMQQRLAEVWYRYRYLNLPMLDADLGAVLSSHKAASGGELRANPGATHADNRRDDAFGTLMQWLYSRMSEVHGKA